MRGMMRRQAALQVSSLNSKYSDFQEIGRNAVMAWFTAPKSLSVVQNETDIFRKIKPIALSKDYVRFWLTREKTSDMSDARGTLWLDLEKREYS